MRKVRRLRDRMRRDEHQAERDERTRALSIFAFR
jgi:hypothetical protein